MPVRSAALDCGPRSALFVLCSAWAFVSSVGYPPDVAIEHAHVGHHVCFVHVVSAWLPSAITGTRLAASASVSG
jgi:hypothetical protein